MTPFEELASKVSFNIRPASTEEIDALSDNPIAAACTVLGVNEALAPVGMTASGEVWYFSNVTLN